MFRNKEVDYNLTVSEVDEIFYNRDKSKFIRFVQSKYFNLTPDIWSKYLLADVSFWKHPYQKQDYYDMMKALVDDIETVNVFIQTQSLLYLLYKKKDIELIKIIASHFRFSPDFPITNASGKSQSLIEYICETTTPTNGKYDSDVAKLLIKCGGNVTPDCVRNAYERGNKQLTRELIKNMTELDVARIFNNQRTQITQFEKFIENDLTTFQQNYIIFENCVMETSARLKRSVNDVVDNIERYYKYQHASQPRLSVSPTIFYRVNDDDTVNFGITANGGDASIGNIKKMGKKVIEGRQRYTIYHPVNISTSDTGRRGKGYGTRWIELPVIVKNYITNLPILFVYQLYCAYDLFHHIYYVKTADDKSIVIFVDDDFSEGSVHIFKDNKVVEFGIDKNGTIKDVTEREDGNVVEFLDEMCNDDQITEPHIIENEMNGVEIDDGEVKISPEIVETYTNAVRLGMDIGNDAPEKVMEVKPPSSQYEIIVGPKKKIMASMQAFDLLNTVREWNITPIKYRGKILSYNI